MWPGQNYKYVTNELFERGPTGDKNDLSRRGATTEPPQAAAKVPDKKRAET